MKTANRTVIAQAIQKKIGISVSDSKDIVDSIISNISQNLLLKGKFNIQNIGSFSITERETRSIHHPKTKTSVKTKYTKHVNFKPSKNLNNKINNEK